MCERCRQHRERAAHQQAAAAKADPGVRRLHLSLAALHDAQADVHERARRISPGDPTARREPPAT